MQAARITLRIGAASLGGRDLTQVAARLRAPVATVASSLNKDGREPEIVIVSGGSAVCSLLVSALPGGSPTSSEMAKLKKAAEAGIAEAFTAIDSVGRRRRAASDPTVAALAEMRRIALEAVDAVEDLAAGRANPRAGVSVKDWRARIRAVSLGPPRPPTVHT